MTTESPCWFKSSYSDNGGDCVEAAANIPGVVPVRDSKDPHGPALAFSVSSWQTFVASVKDGELPTR
ncbi:hypothetical protein SSP35_07_02340 [Streptomyces sp. NBRC 110611]|uniref:DUF397 domain-containing protein n=1 Tax=Streptomyces sp. NBRC 110611 TaxID=1621259 RepID=UPI0008349A16|nr:DUF397 domain-containing protein [Streptomyces sp. NBRC 110611]GAU68432.1 hypothetical protein SSP35_07_02340 [Streptomyces sp. NBRC 110611]